MTELKIEVISNSVADPFSEHNYIQLFIFFFNDTAPTEFYTLSLHDALPISVQAWALIAGLDLDGSLEDLADVIDVCADPQAAVASLRALGALAPWASGWRGEPVLAAAWQTAGITVPVAEPGPDLLGGF